MSDKVEILEEDVEKACKVAVEIFGPMGSMVYPHNAPHIYPNVEIIVDNGYPIWYGDFNRKEDMNKLQELQIRLNMSVSVVVREN